MVALPRAMLPETEPFFVPLGDEILLDGAGSLKFTSAICVNAGGPSQTVRGHVWLTHDLLAFRPKLGMPHPQMVTLDRNGIAEARCVRPKLLGLLEVGSPQLEVSYLQFGTPLPHLFTLDAADRWLEALAQPRRVQELGARDLVQRALRAGERERGRYTTALEQLSFPRGDWYTEDPDARDEALLQGLSGLGIDVADDFLGTLDLEVEVATGPEDYAIGPGTEEWGRREQIRRVCAAVNAAGGAHGRRFYEYAEDLPGWPTCFEPLWLWLSEAEDHELRMLGIVRPVAPP